MYQASVGEIERTEGPSAIKRRLAAIAFADVAHFSRLMAVDDVDTLRRWKLLRTEVLEPHMERHGGRVAQMSGDAMLFEFASVVNAMRWATEVQRILDTDRRERDPAALQLRISINVEDVIDDDGTLQGDGVNIAARMHQAAEPGQVVVTAAVREYVLNRLALEFQDLGTPPMKNILRPVHVYAARWIESQVGHVNAQPYLQWSSRPTIAVLPFRYIGASEENYLGDGITAEIISGLSRSRALYVIASNSTLRYRDRTKEPREIAGELGVRFVLDGSLQRQGDRVRINSELTDTSSNRAIWSERFDGSTKDIFELQDRIAVRTLAAIEPRVQAAEVARVSEHPTESLDAYHCVMKANSLLYRFTPDSYRTAGDLLERAIELDPSYAQAHAYLAWWLNFRIGEGLSDDPDRDRAQALAASRRAMELDRDDSFVLAVAGHICAFIGRNPEEALELFDEALAINENSAFAWGLSALTMAYLGRPDEALERLQNVWRLNPFDALNFYFWIVAGIAEFIAGRYDLSVAWLRKCRRANPRFAANLRTLCASLALSGDEAGARAVAQEFLEIEPGFRISTFLSWYPLRRSEDLFRLGEGLRAAGLPE